MTSRTTNLWLAVLVAALGYFVDIYDIVLFSILRVPSLRALSISGPALTTAGAFLLDVQLAGMILGGIVLGLAGDRRGRLNVVFASILIYSTANFLNAFVTSVPEYAVMRFAAGKKAKFRLPMLSEHISGRKRSPAFRRSSTDIWALPPVVMLITASVAPRMDCRKRA